MSKGVFAVDRRVFEHPTFKREAFTEVQAWIWMLGQACWREHRTRVHKTAKAITLRRGEFALSLRYMAEAWGWKEPRVRRFLNRLKIDAMIDARTDAGVTVVTLRNYDRYQVVSLPKDAASDAEDDARATQARRKEEDRGNIKNIREEDSAPAPSSSGGPYALDTGTKVRLLQKDLDAWVKAFPYINVEAEIWSAHTWAAGQRNWFQALAGKLAKLQREATGRRPPPGSEHRAEAAYDASF